MLREQDKKGRAMTVSVQPGQAVTKNVLMEAATSVAQGQLVLCRSGIPGASTIASFLAPLVSEIERLQREEVPA